MSRHITDADDTPPTTLLTLPDLIRLERQMINTSADIRNLVRSRVTVWMALGISCAALCVATVALVMVVAK